MKIVKTCLAMGVAAIGFGCGGGSVPTDKLASAESSVRAAQELGAQNVPQAELHLRLAKDQVAEARKLSEEGEAEHATALLERARADAELAIALSRQNQAEAELRQTTTSDATPAAAQPDPAVRAQR